jgi:hypothetical protein
MPGVFFPDYPAPVIRNRNGDDALGYAAAARRTGGLPITNTATRHGRTGAVEVGK